MIYLGWAAMYEGDTDAAYFDLLIPRLMEDIVRTRGSVQADIPAASAVRLDREAVEQVARKACEAKDAFHLIFIHGDTGGRNLATRLDERTAAYCDAMHRRCGWPPARCVTIQPRKETESWVLSDPTAVTSALGYSGPPNAIGLPNSAVEAEALDDPKSVLEAAVRAVRGPRRRYDVRQIFPAIAQRQTLAALREAASFQNFESRLTTALVDLGCVTNPA